MIHKKLCFYIFLMAIFVPIYYLEVPRNTNTLKYYVPDSLDVCVGVGLFGEGRVFEPCSTVSGIRIFPTRHDVCTSTLYTSSVPLAASARNAARHALSG